MSKIGWFTIVGILVGPVGMLWANWPKAFNELERVNRQLQGRVVDYTCNHGSNRRIWSRSLGEARDLYVYLPPGYNPCQRYPVMILLHGFALDEQMMLELAPYLDRAIVCGQLPPLIVATPDGSLTGKASILTPGSFFMNTKVGDFEDFVLQDVWDFLVRHYPIRPEREAHILAGVSMGGFAAYSMGIRHRDGFGVVIGVYPPLNLRWIGKDGRYFSNFDPYNWGWRTDMHGCEVIGRFYCGLVNFRACNIFGRIFGKNEEALQGIMQINPIELVDRTCLREGELAMYVAYGGEDEFNIDAQVESFLYLAAFRGLSVGVGYLAHGQHDTKTAIALLPGMFNWLAPFIAPYSPGLADGSVDRSRCSVPLTPRSPLSPPEKESPAPAGSKGRTGLAPLSGTPSAARMRIH